MTIANYDYQIVKGATNYIDVTDVTVGTSVLNITGMTLKLYMADEDGTQVLDKTGVVSDGAGGDGYFLITPSDTTSIDAGDYAFEVWLVDGGSEYRLKEGIINVDNNIK